MRLCKGAPKFKNRQKSNFQIRIWTTSRRFFSKIRTNSELSSTVVNYGREIFQKFPHSKKFILFPPNLKIPAAQVLTFLADFKRFMRSPQIVLYGKNIKTWSCLWPRNPDFGSYPGMSFIQSLLYGVCFFLL